MNVNEVIDRLRAHEFELKQKGVLSLTLFGSLARGNEFPNDVDLAAEFDRSKNLTLLTLVEIENTLTEIVGARVDLSDRSRLNELIRQNAEPEFWKVF